MDSHRQRSLQSFNTISDYRTRTIQFIGTATVLIRYAGFSILTDPNFRHRRHQVRLGYGLRLTRLTHPALELRDLPLLDFVVLSHLYEDHLDRIVAQELDHAVPVLTTPSAVHSLLKKGFERACWVVTRENVTYEQT